MNAKHSLGTVLFFAVQLVAVAQMYPFQDPNLPLEHRVDNVVSLMTLDEKIAFLSQRPGVERLGILAMGHVEGLHGLARGGPSNWGRRDPVPTTTFPQAYGMAQTWNPELMRQAGAIEGYEVRYVFQSEQFRRGGLIVRAPNADLGRDPRWGRTEECYGEDPFFNGTMAAAFIKGLQGDHPRYWLTASLLKHFLANSNEDNRITTSSDFDERLFREYYSVPFRMGFQEGGARCYMTAYNYYNGIPCTVHPIIENVTKKQWGVDGVICTDGGAFTNLFRTQQHYETAVQAGAGTVNAGINQYLDRNFEEPVKTALEQGLLTEKRLEEVIRGTLRVFIRLGWLDPPQLVPYAAIGTAEEPNPSSSDKHKAVALQVTQESIVLLKNADRILPLDRRTLKTIAVLGPRSDEVLLDWYSGTPPYTVSPLQGIKNKVGVNVVVKTAPDAGEAVELARSADVAIVCVGNNPIGVPDGEWEKVSVPSEGREAVDRKSITLEQEEFIKQIYAANPRTVVILISSFPYAINWTQEHVPAIVHITQNSQELGNALADVLLGDYNPAGRLVQTWPKSLEQLPPMMDYNIRNGRTYMYFKGESLYPFGYGLSYTAFEYDNLKTGATAMPRDGWLNVEVEVANTGKSAGDEVIQLYVKHLDSKVERPIQELKGFKRIRLEPGERKRVSFALAARSLAYWDTEKQEWTVEPGRIEIRIGASSADIRLRQTIQIE